MPQMRAFGPLALVGETGDIGLGGPKQRAVLAVLLAERGRLVSTDRLVDEIWGEGPPAAARQSVQSYVSNLRRLLDGVATIDGTGTGYVCRPGPGAFDVDRFEELVGRARAARADEGGGGDSLAGEAYRAALEVAGGTAFEGFEDLPTVAVEATRVESLRLSAIEERLDVELAAGAGPELVPELESLVARHPLRERLWGHLMMALYQAGRQAEALRCFERARRLLADELGIEPSTELVKLERSILEHDPRLPPARAAPRARTSATCPYKGLAPYQPEDAALFCGRQALVDRLLAMIGSARLAAAVGASGSGKSSLLRAGLVPALAAGGWPVALFTPGSDPLAQLARRLSPGGGAGAGGLAEEMRDDPTALHRVVADRLAGAPPGARQLVVVDQLEELFTLCHDDGTRLAFAAALAESVTRPDSRVSVALAVRGDFYGRCAELVPLADLLSRHHVLVGPMSAGELRAAVVEPARRAGLRVDDGLVDDLLADAGHQPGALPLLSHALLETWLRREGTTLTRAGYHDAGGLTGAIARTAEAVVDQLDPAERATVRSVVLDLVQPGADGTPDTGRPMRRADLRAGEAAEAVVEKLTSARLLTRDGDVIALAHESLVTNWPDLQGWLAEERDHLVEYRRLAEAAAEWERLGREPSAVFRGPRLAAAAQLLADDAGATTSRERAFVDAGLAQERRAARRRRQVTSGLAVLAAMATVAAALALIGRGQARHEAEVATSRRLAAQSALALGRNDRAPALLLAVEALRASATVEARSALGEALVADIDAASVLSGHVGDVRSVAVSPTGALAASAGIDGTVRLWDLGRGQEARVFGPFGGEQRDVAFGPDGKAVAAVGIDGVVRVWDAETGDARPDLPLPGPAGAPSPPARTSGGGGGGGGGGAQPSAGEASPEPVTLRAVAWSPDGRVVAASATDGRIHLWDAGSGRLQRSFASGDVEIRDLAFSPDGARLAGAGRDGGVRVWTAEGQPGPVLTGHADVAFGVAWSPDGSRLASVGRDRTLRLWTPATGSQDQVIVAHDAEIFGVAWAAGGSIATASADRMIRLWDGGTGARRAELKGHTSDARSVAFDAGGNLVSASTDGTVRLWKGSGSETVRALGGPTDGVFELAFSGDGSLLAGSGREGSVFVWNVADGSARPIAGATGREVFGVAFRPDGEELAGGERDGSVRLTAPAAGRSTATLAGGPGPVWDVAYSGDGARLVAAGADGAILVWDPRQAAAPLMTLRGHERDVFGVAVHPREPVVASVGRDGTLRRWDLDRGDTGEVLLDVDAELRSVAFSPDGRTLATAGADGTVRLVPSETGEGGRSLLGHEGEVRSVSFSPDGSQLVTAGRDRNVRFWDIGSGRLLASIPVSSGDVRAVAAAPGGDLLAVASNAGAVRVWPALPDWEERACAAAGRNLSQAEWDRLVPGTELRRTCRQHP